jgi:acyl-CoA reductase-like NAD-dependent aldehyde dehydrogenase
MMNQYNDRRAEKEEMNWEQLNEQHRAIFQREYVACHEPHERSWLVEQVLLGFPQYRKSVVERAVQEVCVAMKVTPRMRADFLDRLQQQLERRYDEKVEIGKIVGIRIYRVKE